MIIELYSESEYRVIRLF